MRKALAAVLIVILIAAVGITTLYYISTSTQCSQQDVTLSIGGNNMPPAVYPNETLSLPVTVSAFNQQIERSVQESVDVVPVVDAPWLNVTLSPAAGRTPYSAVLTFTVSPDAPLYNGSSSVGAASLSFNSSLPVVISEEGDAYSYDIYVVPSTLPVYVGRIWQLAYGIRFGFYDMFDQPITGVNATIYPGTLQHGMVNINNSYGQVAGQEDGSVLSHITLMVSSSIPYSQSSIAQYDYTIISPILESYDGGILLKDSLFNTSTPMEVVSAGAFEYPVQPYTSSNVYSPYVPDAVFNGTYYVALDFSFSEGTYSQLYVGTLNFTGNYVSLLYSAGSASRN